MIFQHSRFQIWNANQHPYKHSLSDFLYSNDALPGVTNVQGTLDYIVAVLYPQSMPAVANVAALPALGNSINDMRTVSDDGDGKAASYRWEQREGEASPSWHKIYDLDWGTDSILQGFLLKTQDIYVKQWGYNDLDAAGSPVVGLLAGQSIYGGATANTNLSLFANSGDGTGAATGFVQSIDPFRPGSDNAIDSGTATFRWRKSWQLEGQFGTLNLVGGTISDSTGAISFSNENLTTTGKVSASSLEMNGDGTAAAPSLFWTSDTDSGIYRSAADSIGFATGGTNRASLLTTGLLMNVTGSDATPSIRWAAGTGLWSTGSTVTVSTNSLSRLSIDSSGNTSIDAGSAYYDAVNNRLGLGTVTPGSKLDIVGTQDIEQLSVRGHTTQNLYLAQFYNAANLPVLAFTVDGGLFRPATVAGDLPLINAGANAITFGTNGSEKMRVTSSGNVGINEFFPSHKLEVVGDFLVDNLLMDGNTLSSNNVNGDVNIDANGTGHIIVADLFRPSTNGTISLGAGTARWDTLYLATGIGDGTTVIGSSTLQSLRNINSGVAAGMSLFWSGTEWLASAPDTEITHSSISGLTTGDSGHTQFVMLSGRSGGQSVQGGTVASENLNLESTAHATKGFVQVKDTLQAFTDASFSGSWSGIDLGGASNRFRHVYTAGEFFGFRLENVGANPSPSVQRVGRMVFNTADEDVYVDTGSTLKRITVNRFESDTVWNGSDITKNVTITDVDATKAIWQLCDNTNDYEIVYASIKATSTTNILITVGTALPAGSYRLKGIE